jgi:hypothetical protein
MASFSHCGGRLARYSCVGCVGFASGLSADTVSQFAMH